MGAFFFHADVEAVSMLSFAMVEQNMDWDLKPSAQVFLFVCVESFILQLLALSGRWWDFQWNGKEMTFTMPPLCCWCLPFCCPPVPTRQILETFEESEIFEDDPMELEGGQWNPINDIEDVAEDIYDYGEDLVTDHVISEVNKLAGSIQYIKDFASNAWNAIKGALSSLSSINVDNIWNSVKNSSSSIFDKLKSISMPNVVDLVSKLGVVHKFMTGVLENVNVEPLSFVSPLFSLMLPSCW